MNPNHAACFNELRELCRKYKLIILSSERRLGFIIDGMAIYETAAIFDAEISTLLGNIDIPPPETKGDK